MARCTMSMLQFGRRSALERPSPGRHFVQHDAQREDVRAVVERAPRDLFGRHVGWGPMTTPASV
jgi:hypothetical protein